MIPVKNRIPKTFFPAVMRGTSISGKFFRVIISLEIDSYRPHIAAVASKKQAPTSVLRNRVRRDVYRIAMQKMADLPPKTIVFLLTSSIKATETTRKQIFQEIKEDIDQLFNKIIAKYVQ